MCPRNRHSLVKATQTILLVDDTPANLCLLVDALDGAGYDLRLAESGAAALDQMERMTPDLVFLDAVMPGLDGYAVCVRIKSEPRWISTPVIFMTGLTEPTEKIRAFDVGADDYITRPVHKAEVLAHVWTHLGLRSTQRALEEELALRIDAEAQLSRSLDGAVLVVDSCGRIIFATRLAEILMTKHWPHRVAGQLPAGLCDSRSPLHVRRLQEPGRSDLEMIVLDEAAPARGSLRTLGVSPREADVLFWLAEGKTNGEIAGILGASPRTIEKHVEHILAKLGVESRLAAMRTALDVLRHR